MRRIMAMADRAALLSLKTLVLLNVLFFLCFLLVALMAAREADAAPQLLQPASLPSAAATVSIDGLPKE